MKEKTNNNFTKFVDKMSEPVSPAGVMLSIGALILAGYGMILLNKSENRLSQAKLLNENPPLSRLCNPDIELDMGCYRQLTGELCDGNKTVFNLDDDKCETIEYWNYVPIVNIYR